MNNEFDRVVVLFVDRNRMPNLKSAENREHYFKIETELFKQFEKTKFPVKGEFLNIEGQPYKIVNTQIHSGYYWIELFDE